MNTIDFTADSSADGKTCGDFLRSMGVSRRLMARLKRVPMGISRRGELIKTTDRVRFGDVVSLKNIGDRFIEPNPVLSAPVVYEDVNAAVFDKPAGMPVHPSAGHRRDTLGNCFAAMYPDLAFRPVNRLDKDTSGLCAVAKNAYASSFLSGRISKVYYAVTEGTPIPRDTGNPLIRWYRRENGVYTIDAPLGRADGSVIRREIRSDGRRAVTNYTILKEKDGFCLVRVSLETGRTHQIRVHFSSAGHPLAGDDLYGGGTDRCKAQALHCGEMSFCRPSDGAEVRLSSPLRADMKELIGGG